MKKELLGKNIRVARHIRCLTQAAVAERVGKSVETISNIERGNILPGLETLVALANALEVTPASLLDGLGETDADRTLESDVRLAPLVRAAVDLDDDALRQVISLAAFLSSRSRNKS
jgi:transcriptional regulator with XRE-family HTH domain